MSKIFRNIVFNTIRRVLNLLPKKFHYKAMVQLVLMLLNSIVDLLGLASVIPLLAALLKKGFIEEQPVLRWMEESLGFEDSRWFIVSICGIVFLIVILKNLFALWVVKRQVNFSWSLYEYFSSRMFLSTYERGLEYFSNTNSNKIQNRIVRVPQLLSIMVSTGVFMFLNEMMVLSLIMISITIYAPKVIGLLLVTVAPVFFVFYKLKAGKIKRIQYELNEINPRLNKPVYELSFGYVDVAISGVFNTFQKMFLKEVKELKKRQVKVMVLGQLPSRVVEVCVIATVILILLYGLFVLGNTEEIITLLGAFGIVAYRVVPSINRLMMALVNIKSWEFSLEDIENYITQKETVKNATPITFADVIKLEEIGFKFKDAPTPLFQSVNLDVKKGEAIGLIGRSGSGKTTLMNVLIGFIAPSQGRILVDDKVLDENSIHEWQNLIGYVRQDVFLVDGTIAENIAFGVEKSQIDEKALLRAIEVSSLKEFVDSLEHGMHTKVGERGAKISGGQRQRIGIARSIYHGAEVLFFDEATSALDEKTEKEITQAIETLREYKLTIIIIAHRKSSLKYCDKVYELRNGELMLLNSM